MTRLICDGMKVFIIDLVIDIRHFKKSVTALKLSVVDPRFLRQTTSNLPVYLVKRVLNQPGHGKLGFSCLSYVVNIGIL